MSGGNLRGAGRVQQLDNVRAVRFESAVRFLLGLAAVLGRYRGRPELHGFSVPACVSLAVCFRPFAHERLAFAWFFNKTCPDAPDGCAALSCGACLQNQACEFLIGCVASTFFSHQSQAPCARPPSSVCP
jgi:hypothetical protein